MSQLPNGTVLFTKTYDLGDIPFNRVDDYGVEWHMESLDGWGVPASDGGAIPRAGGHGGYLPNTRFLPPRQMTLTGKLFADTEAVRDAAYFRLVRNIPTNTPVLLKVGESVPLQTYVQRDGEIKRTAPNRYSLVFQVPMVAVDPRKYAQTLQTGTAQLSTAAGLAPPFTPPILLPDSSGGVNTMTMTNNGNFATPPFIQIRGPVANPKLTDLGGTQFMRWALTLSSTETLQVDTFAQWAYVDNIYYPLDWGSSWMDVDPGTSTWQFSGDVTAPGVPTATYLLRDAWE